MPRKSKVFSLPKDLREALNAQLVAGGFQNYQALAAWLNDALAARNLALTVSAMSVNRYGREFEDKLFRLKQATDKARALVDASDDTEGALNDALVRTIQVEIFELLERLATADLNEAKRSSIMSQLTLAVSRIVRASVVVKKWAFMARDFLREEAEKLRQEGYDEDTLNELTRRVEVYLPDNQRTLER